MRVRFRECGLETISRHARMELWGGPFDPGLRETATRGGGAHLAELALEGRHEVGEGGPAEGEHVDLNALRSIHGWVRMLSRIQVSNKRSVDEIAFEINQHS